jgi:alpha-D-ribose 1-methylphosphonate 5-triphosphate synthase subunit PhnI
MYVAVKGGEKAINNAHALLAKQRRGDLSLAELSVAQIQQQLPLAVSRVMSEGAVYDPELAALAIKQAAGDSVEAIFLLRAYRTTLSRFYSSEPLDTTNMLIERRISATFKDLPGGQVLGSTFDYTHRLLDFALMAEGEPALSKQELAKRVASETAVSAELPEDEDALNFQQKMTRVLKMLEDEGMIVPEIDSGEIPTDITQDPESYPSNRSARLQSLTRGDEGFLLALGYSTQRGYGRNHPFAGELRIGEADITICPEELGFTIDIGSIEVTECEMINGFSRLSKGEIKFTRGYGLVFGRNERKAMSVALLDRALQVEAYGETPTSPAQQEEFVLSHCDNVSASGFVSHLKLPHYVDFQSEIELLRRLRNEPKANSSSVDGPAQETL